jgi:aldose 1-epimerase
LTKTLFGHLDAGTPIHEAVLRSPAGAEARVMEWGAVLRDLVVPLPNGGSQRVVLGFPDFARLSRSTRRIWARSPAASPTASGRPLHARLASSTRLPLNQNGRNSLHGGGKGFGKRPWTMVHHDEISVTLALVSPAGDAGYPGTLDVVCRYILVGDATLRIELSATTDAPTIVNLAHHSYFRLDDAPTSSITNSRSAPI